MSQYLTAYRDAVKFLREELQSQWEATVRHFTEAGRVPNAPNLALIEEYCNLQGTGETLRDYADLDVSLLIVGDSLLKGTPHLLFRPQVEQARDTLIAILDNDDEEEFEDIGVLELALFDLNLLLASWPTSSEDDVVQQVRNLILPSKPN